MLLGSGTALIHAPGFAIEHLIGVLRRRKSTQRGCGVQPFRVHVHLANLDALVLASLVRRTVMLPHLQRGVVAVVHERPLVHATFLLRLLLLGAAADDSTPATPHFSEAEQEHAPPEREGERYVRIFLMLRVSSRECARGAV